MLWYIWLIVFLVSLGIEIITTGVFFFLCFSIGALFAMTCSLLGMPEYISAIVFCVVSVLSILFIRPFMTKYVDKKKIETNVDSLIGASAVVVEAITSQVPGKIKIAGEIWLAVCDESVDIGQTVVIVSVDGTKLIVKKNV